jgi:hypothetical protein
MPFAGGPFRGDFAKGGENVKPVVHRVMPAAAVAALFIAGGCQPVTRTPSTSERHPAELATAAPTGNTATAAASAAPATSASASAEAQPLASPRYSAFGPYAALPDWSGWCGLQPDPGACVAPLKHAVDAQSSASRPTVRQHGWSLWASMLTPLSSKEGRNDSHEQRTNLYGTAGCWSKFADGTAACSGVYPLWLTWPNTGKPYASNVSVEAANAAAPKGRARPVPASRAQTLRTLHSAYGTKTKSPDPTQKQTVNTPDAPIYALPPLVLSKECGIPTPQAKAWLDQKAYDAIVKACDAAGARGLFCPPTGDNAPAICDGTAFVNQGDVMIATESLSSEGYEDIQKNKLYDSETLNALYAAQAGTISKDIGPKFISTKHMYWPVKGCQPGARVGEKGCRIRYGALPPWVPKDFKRYSYATNADYLGYEEWQSVVAIDTCGGSGATAACPPGGAASLALQYVTGARPITTAHPTVYPSAAFAHVQVSEDALAHQFTATDRALLDQAMIWAYGDASQGFEPGDFLVTVAMHVNTKEIASWALQSVWWSPMNDIVKDCPLSDFDHCFGQAGAYAATAPDTTGAPNQYSGLTREQIASIDAQVGTSWRAHYLMTDSYGINYELDGSPVRVHDYFPGKAPPWAKKGPSGKDLELLPISANVYIEPVIHPLGTNCQNCHRRAGIPSSSCGAEYAAGCGRANYQTSECADLLGDYGAPTQDPCMTNPWAGHDPATGNHCTASGGTLCKGNDAYPVLDTDWIWLIADQHIQPR